MQNDIDKITPYLDKIIAWCESAGQYVAAEAPLVAQEMVVYGRVEATLAVAGGTIVATLMILTANRFARRYWKEYPDGEFDPEPRTIAAVFLWVGASIPVILTLANMSQFIKVWCAPRLYVLNEIAKWL